MDKMFNTLKKLNLLMMIVMWIVIWTITFYYYKKIKNIEEKNIEETEDNKIKEDIYEYVDPDTGVHYWVYSHKSWVGGTSAMTPRLNEDGSIMKD